MLGGGKNAKSPGRLERRGGRPVHLSDHARGIRACFHRGVAGCPRRRGCGGDLGSDQGEGFPLLIDLTNVSYCIGRDAKT
jgi:hypothetical protein